MRFAFWGVALGFWFGVYIAALKLGSNGSLWVAAVPIVVSPVMMLLTRLFLEYGKPAGLLDPRTQSWAFLFGDTLVLPCTFAALALGWRAIGNHSAWYGKAWWFWTAFVVGIIIACAWHFLLDGPGYKAQGYVELLGSPSKLWHDFVVYGSLSGSLVYLGIPILKESFMPYGAIALVGLATWGSLGWADNSVHKLNPAELHPPVSETIFGN